MARTFCTLSARALNHDDHAVDVERGASSHGSAERTEESVAKPICTLPAFGSGTQPITLIRAPRGSV